MIFRFLQAFKFCKKPKHGDCIAKEARLGKDARGPGIENLLRSSSSMPGQLDIEERLGEDLNFDLEYRQAEYESKDEECSGSRAEDVYARVMPIVTRSYRYALIVKHCLIDYLTEELSDVHIPKKSTYRDPAQVVLSL
jgi:hypothetical protein